MVGGLIAIDAHKSPANFGTVDILDAVRNEADNEEGIASPENQEQVPLFEKIEGRSDPKYEDGDEEI